MIGITFGKFHFPWRKGDLRVLRRSEIAAMRAPNRGEGRFAPIRYF